MNHRSSLVIGALGMASVLVLACAGPLSTPPVATAPPVPALTDPPRRPGKPLVLIAMPDSASFRTVRRAMVNEIKQEFDVATEVIDARTKADDFSKMIDTTGAVCAVLMDNPAVKLYRTYQKSREGHGSTIPAVVVMAAFLEEIRGELHNASGVAYEVPGVTAFVNLRSVVQSPVSRVGVLHRPGFRRFLERQTLLAAKEQITLVPIKVPTEPTIADVQKALDDLRATGLIDALWVLNDNGLLRDASFIDAAWRDGLAALHVPVVVGVPTLVAADARFGTLAVLPDLDAMGAQAANVLLEVADNGWRASQHGVELPISTVTVVNMRQVRQEFGLREGAGGRIDKAIE